PPTRCLKQARASRPRIRSFFPGTGRTLTTLREHLQGSSRGSIAVMVIQPSSPQDDWSEHERTYRGFVRGVLLFAAHVLISLLILAWVFSGSFNSPPLTS